MSSKNVLRLLGLLILAGLIVLAGCAPQQDGDDQAQEEDAEPAQASYVENRWTDGEDLSGRTVRIFGAFVDTDAERFNESMAPFEEETGIEVQYEGSGDFESLISVRVEGGDPPDIAAFPQPGLMEDITERGHVLDLGDWFDMSFLQEQYSQTWIDYGSVEDILAGIWYRASVKSLVWYPVPEFEEAGYEIPETWDEMMALTEQMAADGNVPWSIGIESAGATGWVGTDWVEDILLRTQPPEVYDQWVAGELDFNSPEIRNTFEIMADIWKNQDYVLGGANSILTTPFGDAVHPLLDNPPTAWLHRQASFITGFWPEDQEVTVGEDIDYFYLPPIDEELGRPVLGAGDIMSAMQDDPEVRAVMQWLAEPESKRGWIEAGGFVSPNQTTPLDWYPTEADRGYAEILNNATTFRFDASDLMPGQVGAGSFWDGVVEWVQGTPTEQVLESIDQTWPEEGN
jgi:alpha-glucoside transport system substrate-binding protein